MDTRLLKQLRQYLNKEKIKFNRRLAIFLFFVAVSTVFWFLLALSEEYVTQLSYPVRYQNMPKDKVLIKELPESLNLKVKSFGFTLLKYKLNHRLLPIAFDVNSFALNKVPNTNDQQFFLLTSFAHGEIENQLDEKIEILYIDPDTLLFCFSSIMDKKISIVPKLNYTLEQQYMLNGSPLLKPEIVTISGPKNLLDSISNITTESVEFGTIKENTRKKVSLVLPDGITCNNSNVIIEISVEKFTESEIMVPVNIINLPDSLEMTTYPEKVKVTFFVGISNFEKIRTDHFEVVGDFNDIENSISKRIPVQIKQFPEFVTSIQVFPRTVEYLIRK